MKTVGVGSIFMLDLRCRSNAGPDPVWAGWPVVNWTSDRRLSDAWYLFSGTEEILYGTLRLGVDLAATPVCFSTATAAGPVGIGVGYPSCGVFTVGAVAVGAGLIVHGGSEIKHALEPR